MPDTDATGLPIVPGADAQSAARAAGYEWGEIQAHVDNATTQAQAAGYSQPEIDAHQGYSGPSQLVSRMQTHAQAEQDPLPNIIAPPATAPLYGGSVPVPAPGKAAGPLTPEIAQHYADALGRGEVKTPGDFGSAYAQAMGVENADHANVAAADIARQLPSTQEITDHGLAILGMNGEPMDAQGARTARANLAQLWVQTGQQPADVFGEHDPLVHDAVTTPGSFAPIVDEGAWGVDPEALQQSGEATLKAIGDWVKGMGKDLAERGAPPETEPAEPGAAVAKLAPGQQKRIDTAFNIALSAIGAEGDAGKSLRELVESAPKGETVKASALRVPDGTVYEGTDHGAAFDKMSDEHQSGQIEEGFTTSEGRFVDRQEAAKIAIAQRQGQTDAIDEAGLTSELLEPAAAVEPKPFDMTTEELDDAIERKGMSDRDLLVKAFGGDAEKAKRFDQLDRKQNSSMPDRADEGARQMAEEFGDLTAEQERLIYGIGDTDAQVDDLRALRQAREPLDGSNDQEVARVLTRGMLDADANDLRHFMATGEGSYTTQAAAARIQTALDEMARRGLTREQINEATHGAMAARGYSPEEAKEVLSGFYQGKAGAATETSVPRLSGARPEEPINLEPPAGLGHNGGPPLEHTGLVPEHGGGFSGGPEPPPPGGPPAIPNGGLVPHPGFGPDLPAVSAETPGVRSVASTLEDELNRLRTNNTADKIKLMQWARSVPDEFKDKAFQKEHFRQVEERLKAKPSTALTSTESGAKLGPETNGPVMDPEHQAFEDWFRPFTDTQTQLAKDVAGKVGEAKGLVEPDLAHILTVDQGYARRVVKGREGGMQSPVDPSVDRNAITGGRPSGLLSRFSPSQQHRLFYVLEHGETGERVFGQTPMDDLGIKFGEEYKLSTEEGGFEGDTWKVRPATAEEVEKNTDIQYHQNFMANTIDNIARLSRVNRALDFFATQAKALREYGMFEPRGKDQFAPSQSGWARVELPGMDGWAPPRIANVLNDFISTPDDLENVFGRMNRFVAGAMFSTPVPHIANVFQHYVVGRGADWFTPYGYGRLIKSGYRAFRAVMDMNDDMENHLREGSGLQYGNVETENMYRFMMHKLFNEQLGDEHTWGDYAKTLGFAGVKDLVRAEYAWSRRSLWRVNDMFLLARQFELEAKGMGIREAIAHAERDIPNYRVPSSVLFNNDTAAHALGMVLKSPNFTIFGRYHYGLVRSLATIAQDIGGRSNTMGQRLDGVAKATVMGAMALGAYPLMNMALQHATGNKDASFFNSGPFKVVNGLLGTGLSPGQSRLGAVFGGLATLSPMLGIASMIVSQRDTFGNHIADLSRPLIAAEQYGEAAGNAIYPTRLIEQIIKQKSAAPLLAQLGVNMPSAAAQNPKWAKRDAAQQLSRDRKGPVSGWMMQHGMGFRWNGQP